MQELITSMPLSILKISRFVSSMRTLHQPDQLPLSGSGLPMQSYPLRSMLWSRRCNRRRFLRSRARDLAGGEGRGEEERDGADCEDRRAAGRDRCRRGNSIHPLGLGWIRARDHSIYPSGLGWMSGRGRLNATGRPHGAYGWMTSTVKLFSSELSPWQRECNSCWYGQIQCNPAERQSECGPRFAERSHSLCLFTGIK